MSGVSHLGQVSLTMVHQYETRIIKERDNINTLHTDIILQPVECIQGIYKWMVVLTNGIHVVLTMGRDFPFKSPSIKFIDFRDVGNAIKFSCENEWSCGMRIDSLIRELYRATESVRMVRAGRGILLCVPMLMLWRKRAAESLYHPSRIDFHAEYRKSSRIFRVSY